MNFFKVDRSQLKTEFFNRTVNTDKTWASELIKDKIKFFIILVLYFGLAYFFFPTKPEIYLGIGIPLFYIGWLILINFIDSNRFSEQISNSTTANLAHKYTSE